MTHRVNFRLARTISSKTIDTNAPSYQNNPNQAGNAINKYVNDIVDFSGGGNNDFSLSPDDIQTRTLQVAIPANTSAEQMAGIARAVQSGKQQGVNVVVTLLK